MARSWSGPPLRGSWVWPPGRREGRALRRHALGRGRHLTSPMRRVRQFPGRATAVTWSRHWSGRLGVASAGAWRRVWQIMPERACESDGGPAGRPLGTGGTLAERNGRGAEGRLTGLSRRRRRVQSCAVPGDALLQTIRLHTLSLVWTKYPEKRWRKDEINVQARRQ
jgi:hypothetical protein